MLLYFQTPSQIFEFAAFMGARHLSMGAELHQLPPNSNPASPPCFGSLWEFICMQWYQKQHILKGLKQRGIVVGEILWDI